jgi:DNA-binding transcriptional LysR family regulator
VVTDAIIAYQQQHPDTHFSLLQNPDAKGCDLTLTTARSEHGGAGENTFVIDEQIYLAVPRTGKYGARQSLTLGEVAEENFISLAGSRRFRGICDRYCMEAGFTPHIGFESDNPASVRNLIAARAGVGFWPAFSFGHYDDEGVLLLPIDDVNCRRLLILHHHPRTTANADGGEQLRFFRFLSDYFTRARDTARR